ncbi:hypothetical protein [Pseudomonas massiliensis]|uniref:hypothetical protein n=1 Tax=Pseudomonas massiliensis TaxID=522492 RepID=UPI00059008CF|nr:hypothetical protein [Pseudomonas massiliensis]
MSSPRKQQKKHKRASAKARQNRILRNNQAAASTETNPDALSPEFISMEEFFVDGLELGAFDDLFDDMAAAEPEGLEAVARAFFKESPLPLVVENYSEEDVTDLVVSLWVAYYEKHHGLNEDQAMIRIESPEFMQAYQAAADDVANQP